MRGLSIRGIAVDLTPVRESPPFRWLWLGDILATFGRQISNVAIPLQVYTLTHSSLMVGLLSLVEVIPLIMGSLVGGVVVDAHDRRTVILITQSSVFLLAAMFAINADLGHPQLWLIFVLGVMQAWISGFDTPARRAALANIVGVRLLPSALALQQVINNLSKLGGPALAGVLIALAGVRAAYWLWAAAVLGAVLAATRLPKLPPRGGGRKAGWSSLVEGLSYVSTKRLIRSIFYVDISATVLGLPRALFPAIGTTVLGGTAATVGLLYAAPGAGAFIGALTSGWLKNVQRQGRAVLIAVGCYGLAMAGFGLSHWLVLTLLCLAIAGASDMFSAVLRNSMVQAGTPDELRGRVTSVNKAVVSGGPMLGDARAGAVATLTSPVAAVASGGFASVAVTLLIAWRYPDLRRAQLRGEELVVGPPRAWTRTAGEGSSSEAQERQPETG